MSVKSVIFHRTKAGFENCDPDAWDDFAVVSAYDLAVSSTPVITKEIIPSHSPGVGVNNELPIMTTKNEESSNFGEVVWSRSPGVEVMTQPNNDSISKVGKKKKRNNRFAKRRKQASKSQWKVGDTCMAVYQEDQLFYKATIKEVHNKEGTVVVNYTEYGEDEVLAVRDIYPESLWTEADKALENEQNSVSEHLSTTSANNTPARKHKRKRQRLNQNTRDSHAQGNVASMPHKQNESASVFPPPPFFPTSNGLNIDVSAANINNLSMNASSLSKDALSSMLVSWYMAGYHTGYYRGLTNSSDQ